MLDSLARVTASYSRTGGLGVVGVNGLSLPHLSQSGPANDISEAVVWLTIIKYDSSRCVHKNVDRQIAFRCQRHVALDMAGLPPCAGCARFVCEHIPPQDYRISFSKGLGVCKDRKRSDPRVQKVPVSVSSGPC